MIALKDEELMNVEGGGFNLGIAVAIASTLTFIVGILDGLIRPLKCR